MPGILLFFFLGLVCVGALYFAYRQLPSLSGSHSEPAKAAATKPPEARAQGRTGQGEGSRELPAAEGSAGAEAAAGTLEQHNPSEPELTHPDAEWAYGEPESAWGPPPDARPTEAAPGARVAVVIDDLGRSLQSVRDLESLEVALSYAVLPFESRTPEVVEALRRNGEEILLHLPMEGSNGADPGPGALRLAMSDEELTRSTEAALRAVPGAVGVNNHMGSLLSADRRVMRQVLSEVARHGLYFLDSRTSPQTVAYTTAASLGVPAAERQVFLDPDPSPEAIAGQFWRLLELARHRGSAIAIGHPYPSTLEVLHREIPAARRLGYEFVPVSYLVNRIDVLPE